MCDTIFIKYQGEVDLDINWFELYPDSVQELTPVTPDTKYKIVRITIFFEEFVIPRTRVLEGIVLFRIMAARAEFATNTNPNQENG